MSLKRQQIKVNKLSEKGKEFNMPTFGGGVNSKELAIFTRQFSVMIDAGLPLVQCLGNSCRAAGKQNLSKGPQRRERFGGRRRYAFCLDEAVRKGVRRALRTTWWRRARPAVFSTPFFSAWPATSKKT
jgi:hypothetical protein